MRTPAVPALLTFQNIRWSVQVKHGKVTQTKQIIKGVTGFFEVRVSAPPARVRVRSLNPRRVAGRWPFDGTAVRPRCPTTVQPKTLTAIMGPSGASAAGLCAEAGPGAKNGRTRAISDSAGRFSVS